MKKILLAAALFLPALPLFAAPSGCLYDLSGPVEIFKAGAPGWAPARKGDALDQGDRVRTGEKAWCELLLRDGSYVKLDAGSETAAEHIELYLNVLRHVNPALTGEDLIKMGITRGPRIKDVLEKLHEARLDGKIDSKKALTLFAKLGFKTLTKRICSLPVLG